MIFSELIPSPLFRPIYRYLRENATSSDTIYLFVPYIKTKILQKLVEGLENKIIIITTWNPRDIQLGSSELSLYPFCKERDIELYIHDNIHLKVYSVGLASAILATGNVSARGLLPNGNEEMATMIKKLTDSDRASFKKIQEMSRKVNDTMYEVLKKWSDENVIKLPPSPKLDEIIPSDNDFLISELPMTHSIDDLVKGYMKISQNEIPSDNLEIKECIYYDLKNYDITPGLSKDVFLEQLSTKFFAHPFIKKIDTFIDPEAYFGSIKMWIQNNCKDVPVPSRRDLTGNVQVLLEWFTRLDSIHYTIDRPNHSQRITKIKDV